MPDGKISDDTAISSLAGSEVIPVVQSGSNKTVTPTQFFSWLEEQDWTPTGTWDFSNASVTGLGLELFLTGFNEEQVYIQSDFDWLVVLDNGVQKVMNLDSLMDALAGMTWNFSGDFAAYGNPFFDFGGADVDFDGANLNFAGANITGLDSGGAEPVYLELTGDYSSTPYEVDPTVLPRGSVINDTASRNIGDVLVSLGDGYTNAHDWTAYEIRFISELGTPNNTIATVGFDGANPFGYSNSAPFYLKCADPSGLLWVGVAENLLYYV